MFRFRPWDQHAGVDPEFQTPEFLSPGDVLRGTALDPLVKIAGKMQLLNVGEFVLGMRAQKCAVAAGGVH
jgi:hypothetical protein